MSKTGFLNIKKKSQLQMMQTVVVLLIFFVLLVIGLIFVFFNQRSNLKEKQREYTNLELMKKAQVLNFMPELQCSFDNVINPDCYDIEKINAFESKVYADNKYFYDALLGNSRITILRFDMDAIDWDPAWGSADGKLIYDNKKPDYKQISKVQLPISLYDPEEDEYYFGLINLEIYS
ncbi:hypothetical protein JXB41_04455 [Candidatus Woesearchaeota archaeon]|nr:hypothetical protein [Candidatus Woesearchaeota archaeon]